jgi:hypothetical protein
MKTLFALLLATLCAATSYGQTIKSLGYNTTNGNIVAATNVVWTNAFGFSSNSVATQTKANLGLGVSDSVEFGVLIISNSSQMSLRGENGALFFWDDIDDERVLFIPADTDPVQINSQWNDQNVRGNLGLPLPALTNTSNVTAMRALAGSTNTNEPYSGTVALTNTNVLTFSNGVLLKIQ